MKKKFFGIFVAFILLIANIVPIKSINAEEPEDWFEITWHFEYNASNNTWYYVTECTDTPGDECNCPGSIHRTQIWD